MTDGINPGPRAIAMHNKAPNGSPSGTMETVMHNGTMGTATPSEVGAMTAAEPTPINAARKTALLTAGMTALAPSDAKRRNARHNSKSRKPRSVAKKSPQPCETALLPSLK